MNKEEFIGKLQMVYVGDRNAFDEIVEDNQKLKNEVVYSKVEIGRLKNIINRIDNFVDRTIEVIKHQPSDNDEWILERLNGIKHLIELKENNKDAC